MSSDEKKEIVRTVKAKNIETKQEDDISFFTDDTVETVLQRISEKADIHPDRLFVTVTLKRSKTYYADDPRRWAALFNRLSYGGKTVLKLPFQLYQTYYRKPQPPSVNFSDFGGNEWTAMPIEEELKGLFESEADFEEHLIFGTEEATSYILPIDYDPTLTSKIPAAAYPIPQKSKLMSSLYPNVSDIQEFTYTAFTPDAEASKAVYFPFFQTTTPERLPVTTLQILNESTDRLRGLLEKLNPDPPKTKSIVRARFRIPFVETNFGPAVQNRFEQMFYGLTVTPDTPVISLFTSPTETSRHKFFVSSGAKKPEHLDWWKAWWSATKPYKNKPTLILYRGDSPQHYDRIAITSTEMIIMSFRPEGKEPKETKLKTDLAKWIQTLDSILPFTNPNDFNDMRWETQDMSLLLKYGNKLTEYDLHRFGCMTSIFDMSDAEQSTFRLLRTDHSVEGLTSMEVRIIQLLKEKVNVTIADIQTDLGVSQEVALTLKDNISRLIEENPAVMNRSFRGFPTMRLGNDTILVSSTKQFDLSVKYASILRSILANANPEDLNKYCPARKDVVPAQTMLAPAQNMEVNTELMGEYESLFEGMEEEEPPPKQDQEIMTQPAAAPPAAPDKVKPKSRATLYNYFNVRLQKFDDKTFDPTDSEYPKKCEQKNQPVILSNEDLERIKTSPKLKNYDPRLYTEVNQRQPMPETNPRGIAICPEYWCMTDEIPLRESDLRNEDGILRCPECNGKIRSSVKDDANEFSVISRDKAHKYPGWTPHKSPINGERLPCCYKKPEKNRENTLDHFYIFDQDKHPLPVWRCAALPLSFFDTFFLEYNRENGDPYSNFVNMRFTKPSGKKNYFRVGLGRPALTLPRFLGNEKFKIPNPSENVENILKCSFVSTWRHTSDTHVDEIMKMKKSIDTRLAKIISGIDDAFRKGDLDILQELEYAAVCMGTDVFRVHIDTMTLGCTFYSYRFKKMNPKAIVVLQYGDYIDILSAVEKIGEEGQSAPRKGPARPQGDRDYIPLFKFYANIHDRSLYDKRMFETLDELRSNNCFSKVPTYIEAKKVMDVLGEPTYSIITDPYKRAQAFYVELPGSETTSKVILPFQPIPIPEEEIMKSVIDGYENVKFPTYESVKLYLAKIPPTIQGYKPMEDAFNLSGMRTEMILDSGLRIPVVPSPVETPSPSPKEVIHTTKTLKESTLTFGEPDKVVKEQYADISYASEIFDFLLFELSKDLKEEALDLRTALDVDSPKAETIHPILKKWYDATVKEVDVSSPENFVTKVRTPCGQFKENECGGNVCAWNGKTCGVKVRKSAKPTNIYNRLLSSLVGNPKVRYIVLEGRSTPFFSTILYVELPHELIVTDGDLASMK
jgi:hypothetical protein